MIRPIIYRTAQVERFLAHTGITLQPLALDLLLDVLEPVMADTFRFLERRASGDYRPDLLANHFPTFDPRGKLG